MSFIESIIYGVVSGLSEILPISSQGHQSILLKLFGWQHRDPLADLLAHIAVLIAVLMVTKPARSNIRRSRAPSRRRSVHGGIPQTQYDLRLIKTAAVPLCVGMLFYVRTETYEFRPLLVSLFFLINGLILIVPEYIRHGNKDARFLTGLDGLMLGLFGAVSVLPGISRMACMDGYCLSRGADRQKSVQWLLFLSIPALVVWIGLDFYHLFNIGPGIITFLDIVRYIFSGISAYLGAYFGIISLRFLSVRTGFAGFAYYSWGVAFFNFILYLIS